MTRPLFVGLLANLLPTLLPTLLLGLLLNLVLITPVQALSYLRLNVGTIDSQQWQARDVAITLNDLDSELVRLQGRALQLKVPQVSPKPARNLSIGCDVTAAQAGELRCNDGQLTFDHPQLQARQSPVSITHQPTTGLLSISLSAIQLLSGRLDTRLELQLADAQPALQANLRLKGVQLDEATLGTWLTIPDGTSFSGKLNGKLDIAGNTDALRSRSTLTLSQLAFSHADGSLLGDSLTADLSVRQVTRGNQLVIPELSLTLRAGEILTPWFYSDFGQRQLSLSASQLKVGDNSWKLAEITIDDGVLSASASQLAGEPSGLQQFSLDLAAVDLADVYPFYLQPVFSRELAQMEIEGEISAQAQFSAGQLAGYDVQLAQVSFSHAPASGAPKYAVFGLDGQLLHDNTAVEPLRSQLGFDSARLLDTLDIGALSLPLQLTGDSLTFTEAVEVPVFDGQLVVEQFDLAMAQAHPAISFAGYLTPIDLTLITDMLGWPTMQGRISGVIPQVSYRERNAQMDGTLLIKVFDGSILMKDLRTSHLLSDWPVIQTDLQFIGIDLEQLTQTFEFGRITGLIDGRVEDLVLENWRPTQFDALFETPQQSTRKRISQKAVDNISNLGGAGVAGALSRTFMRFFEDFGYDRIGFSCVLRDGICEMDGVAPANQGYYLVKGGGIPRIDVIGHNRQTDWNLLVDRLISISESGTPTIQ